MVNLVSHVKRVSGEGWPGLYRDKTERSNTISGEYRLKKTGGHMLGSTHIIANEKAARRPCFMLNADHIKWMSMSVFRKALEFERAGFESGVA